LVESGQGDLQPAAQAVLQFRFTDADQTRIAELWQSSGWWREQPV
jgi:hypothetical protein